MENTGTEFKVLDILSKETKEKLGIGGTGTTEEEPRLETVLIDAIILRKPRKHISDGIVEFGEVIFRDQKNIVHKIPLKRGLKPTGLAKNTRAVLDCVVSHTRNLDGTYLARVSYIYDFVVDNGEPKRRGRKPGSKNKPKITAPPPPKTPSLPKSRQKPASYLQKSIKIMSAWAEKYRMGVIVGFNGNLYDETKALLKEAEAIKARQDKSSRKKTLCVCGCGRTLIGTDSRGRPRKYILGHNMRKGKA